MAHLDEHVRRIPLSHRSHVTDLQGLPGVAVDYESALGRDFVLLTLFDDPAIRIAPGRFPSISTMRAVLDAG